MSIEKMNYVNVHGPKDKLIDTLSLLAKKECFHPDETGESNAFHVNVSDNPYSPVLAKLTALCQTLGIEPAAGCPDKERAKYKLEEAALFAETLSQKVSVRTARIGEINDTLSVNEPAKVQMSHLLDIHTSFSNLFASTLKIRFGRLPKDSYPKVAYFTGGEDIQPLSAEPSEEELALKSEMENVKAGLMLTQTEKNQMEHLLGLPLRFDELFSTTLKIRFGRIPKESYEKLHYFSDKDFAVIEYDVDSSYCWCVYFATQDNSKEIDALFATLFFERVRIPKTACGTPQETLDSLTAQENALQAQLACLEERLGAAHEAEIQRQRELTQRIWKDFAFVEYDFDGAYYWCAYFATQDNYKEIDSIFASLFFERVRIPDFVTTTPAEALASLEEQDKKLQAELAQLKDMSDLVPKEDFKQLNDLAGWTWYQQHLYDLEKYALVLGNTFYLSGFIPRSLYTGAVNDLSVLENVEVTLGDEKSLQPGKTPTKLKNGIFSKPFEGFVSMYGLPSYNDIDPTRFFSLIYALLFGIMFADLGQGLVLVVLGWYFFKKKGMWLGGVIERCGFVSAFFGFWFGSVFGFEDALDPVFHAMGFAEKPMDVMAPSSANFLLITAVAIGVVIIVLSIGFNILSKLRRGMKGELFFSTNGLPGLVMYLSIIALAVGMLVLKINVLNPVFIIVCIGIPFLCMYFQEPLIEWANGHKVKIESKGELLSLGFFEMFDVLISFASNTLSFLRVGGFVLAHAGMMSVVFTLAHMISGFGSPIVIVLGNLFVMGMEGLIVGIQVLRLGYYEMFSRFYDASGIPFTPISLKQTNN